MGRSLYQNRTGLLVGALVGLFSGGLFGVLFGAGVGFFFQRSLKGVDVGTLNPQKAFFEATFAVMGKVAKANGRVTEEEILYAREVMARMNLSEAKRREAIELFNRGKQADFEVEALVRPLARLINHRAAVKQMFVEIQLQAAFADGPVGEAELQVIQEICALLRIEYAALEQILRRCQAEQAFHSHARGGQRSWQSGANEAQLLREAYGVLGVDESAPEAELKKAYRRLMSQHHPDKLIARGLPEEMMELAKEKTQEIQSAYDRIRRARRGQR
nr:co-chaperone DjlA [Motiliproteus sp. SC1-56]